MRIIIPNRNKVLENEIAFLEEKYRQGFKLATRGRIFYQFTPVSSSDVAYEIDLVPRSIANDELYTTEWEVIETIPIFYKKLKKVYYLSKDPENRLLIDERLRLNYYKRMVFLWKLLCSIPFLLLFIFFLAEAPLAPHLTASIPILLLPIPLLIYMYLPFNKEIRSLREKLGEEIDFPVFYLITFLNPTSKQKQELDEKFTTIGSVVSQTRREDRAYYYLKSLIQHIPELKQELMNITTIQEENIKIVRQSGVYSMPMVASGWDQEE